MKTRAVAGEDEGGARARVCGGACAALRDEANAPGDERFVASQNSSNCQIHDDARWIYFPRNWKFGRSPTAHASRALDLISSSRAAASPSSQSVLNAANAW